MGIIERKEREKEQRRDEIINAARDVFFEKGLQVATMDEIAEKAELGKSTLYLYYKSKEDLYLSVMMQGTAILHRMFVDAASTGEPTAKLVWNLGEAYLQFFKQNRNYFRMYYFFENRQLHSQVSQEMLSMCSESDKGIWEIVVGLLEKGVQEGVFTRDTVPMQSAVMLWANVYGLLLQLDRNDAHWKDKLGIDLEATLRKSTALLLEAMMTEAAKKQYRHLLVV